MSFILEALKKSEQQRQEKHVSQQKVRNRTLSLTSSQSGRRPYWLLAGCVSLVLLGGWWFYSNQEATLEQPLELSPAASAPPASSPPQEAEPLVMTAPVPLDSPLPQPVAVAESAPVPSMYVSPPPAPARAAAAKRHNPAVQPQRDDDTPMKTLNTEELVETVDMAQPQPQAIDTRALESRARQMLFYSELPGEMRDRMPPLSMSMHFYNYDPNRRLVRINDLLLREGDRLSRDLELVEITPNGVTLDFLGTAFELPGSKR
ncbi:MAG: general secretion pathway protein GspB [Desulfuromonadales bacterium]